MLVFNYRRRNVVPDRDCWDGRWRFSVKANVDVLSRSHGAELTWVSAISLGIGKNNSSGRARPLLEFAEGQKCATFHKHCCAVVVSVRCEHG